MTVIGEDFSSSNFGIGQTNTKAGVFTKRTHPLCVDGEALGRPGEALNSRMGEDNQGSKIFGNKGRVENAALWSKDDT